MARWKLTEPHYLNAVGKDQSEWEQKETDRTTGRTARVVFKVPRLLDPKDPADYNYREDGIIVVCYEGKGKPRDIIFEGEPTPGMEPMDDEAQSITDSLRPNWHDPINEFSAMDRNERLVMNLQEQIADLKAKQPPSAEARYAMSVDPKQFADLQEKVAALMEQNAQLQLQLAEKPARRV